MATAETNTAEDAALELRLLLDDVGVFLANVYGNGHVSLLSPGSCATAFSALPVPSLNAWCTNVETDLSGTTVTPDMQAVDVLVTAENADTVTNSSSNKPETHMRKCRTNKPKHKPTNQRQKEELTRLRKTSSELQQELSLLQARRVNKNSNRRTSGSRGSTVNFSSSSSSEAETVDLGTLSSSLGVTIWETLAKRQRKERTRAEKENAQLKENVADQIKFVKSLERQLRKRQNLEEVQGYKRHCVATMTPQESEIFRELSRHSEARIASFDQIFDAHGLGSAGPIHYKPLNEAQVAYNDELGMHVNFVKSSVMPFDFLVTADAIWKHMAAREVALPHSTLTSEVIEQSENALATVRVVVMKKNSCEAPCTTIYSVCKRIVHQDHMRLVWEAFTESKQGSPSGKVLVQLMHTGWTKVSRMKTEDGSIAALVQSYSRISPPTTPALQGAVDTSQLPLHQWRGVGVFTDRLISSYQESVQSVRQLIENELMDDFFKTQACSRVCK